MKITKLVIRAVEDMDSISIGSLSRPLPAASSSAPTAPMAPPSVGVAQPMKMVPEHQEDERQRRNQRDQHPRREGASMQRASLWRQRRRHLWPNDGVGEDIEGVAPGEQQPRQQRALVHVADRAAEHIGHHDQHQRGRNDLRQGAARGDDTGRQTRVIAVAQHDGQRDQPHGDDRGRHHPRGRGQQRADEDDGIGESAANAAEDLADGVQQLLGHAAAFQDQPHEGEERHGQQDLVAHDAEHPIRQRLQQRGGEHAEFDADPAEQHADGGERKGDRIADQQEEHQRREHHRRQVGGEPGFHVSVPPACRAAADGRLGRRNP